MQDSKGSTKNRLLDSVGEGGDSEWDGWVASPTHTHTHTHTHTCEENKTVTAIKIKQMATFWERGVVI